MHISALRTSDRVSVPGPKGGLQRAVITGITGSANRQQVKVKCANGDEGILRQLVGTEVAVNVGGNVFVTKPEEVCGGLVQFRDVARKAVHDAVGEPDTDSSMSVVDDGEYAFENWEEEYTKAHRLMNTEGGRRTRPRSNLRRCLPGGDAARAGGIGFGRGVPRRKSRQSSFLV